MKSVMSSRKFRSTKAVHFHIILLLMCAYLVQDVLGQEDGNATPSSSSQEANQEIIEFKAKEVNKEIKISWKCPISMEVDSIAIFGSSSHYPKGEPGDTLIKAVSGEEASNGDHKGVPSDSQSKYYYSMFVYNKAGESLKGAKAEWAPPLPKVLGKRTDSKRGFMERLLEIVSKMILPLIGFYAFILTYIVVRLFIMEKDVTKRNLKDAFRVNWKSHSRRQLLNVSTRSESEDNLEVARKEILSLKQILDGKDDEYEQKLELLSEEIRESSRIEYERAEAVKLLEQNRLREIIQAIELNLANLQDELSTKTDEQIATNQKLTEIANQLRQSKHETASLVEETRKLQVKNETLVNGVSKSLGPKLTSTLDRLQLDIIPLVIGSTVSEEDTMSRLSKLTSIVGALRELSAGIDLVEMHSLIQSEGAGLKALPAAIRELSEIAKQADNKLSNLFGSGSSSESYNLPDLTAPEFPEEIEASYFEPLVGALLSSLGRAKRISEAGVDISMLEKQLRRYILDEAASKYFIAEAEIRSTSLKVGPRLKKSIALLKDQLIEILMSEYSLEPQLIMTGQPFNDKEFRIAGSASASQYPSIRENGIAEVITWGYMQVGSDKVIQKAEVIVRS